MREVWKGEFGDEYTARNLDLEGRGEFWNDLTGTYGVTSALEVGCGIGANLKDMDISTVGADVNQQALDLAHAQGIANVNADATDLPFGANQFDLVLTFGCLIHIPPDDLETAMREIVRVSRRFVFCGEYLGDDEVPWRGGTLWRRPYGALYEEIGLETVEAGILSGMPWDRGDVNWWLLSQGEVK